ncbi:polyprenyl synthetase family protein [Nonomuraea sediminis]|uniref:polyprenyl synthetase family protein n=1 Tax=Nonomuraea sediminis TaxID=2835864 RepID=UPI001BDC21F1|nr:polyprenyl synthetase family protein [Nonomuraea sediminis]
MTADIVESTTREITADVRRRVDDRLAAFLDAHPVPVAHPGVAEGYRLLHEFVTCGGKRIRPILCYWGWRGAGGDDDCAAITAGAALELYHAGLLIHDDVIDGSVLRRGRPTVHRALARRGEVFGHAAAILLGAQVQAWADELLSEVADPRVRALFDLMRAEVLAGQYLDILAHHREDPGVEQALTVIRFKTAKYTVERPLQIGGALAGAGPEVLAAYSRFGLPLGEAFQLRDDVLGVFGEPAATGKPNLDDLREGKQTVLIAHAAAGCTPAQRRELRLWHGNPALDEEHAATLRQIIAETGALAHVESMIELLVEKAIRELRSSPVHPGTHTAMTVLADVLTRRTR